MYKYVVYAIVSCVVFVNNLMYKQW